MNDQLDRLAHELAVQKTETAKLSHALQEVRIETDRLSVEQNRILQMVQNIPYIGTEKMGES